MGYTASSVFYGSFLKHVANYFLGFEFGYVLRSPFALGLTRKRATAAIIGICLDSNDLADPKVDLVDWHSIKGS